MAYSAPTFVRSDHTDAAAQLTAESGQTLGEGIAAGFKGLSELIGARQEDEGMNKSFDVLAARNPWMKEFEDEYYSTNRKGKQAMLGTLHSLVEIDREAREFDWKQQLANRDYDFRTAEANRDYGFRMMNAQQDADYKNAVIDNMNADNVMRANRDLYEQTPDNQKPLYKQLPDGTMAVGVQGTKSGTRWHNFLPPRKQGASGIGELVPFSGSNSRVTSYGYANDETPDDYSSAGIGAFVPDAEQRKIRAGQDSAYRLRPGDLAFSPDLERQLRAAGVQQGEEVGVVLDNGQTHIGRFMDRTSGSLTGRVDFYSPEGRRPDDGTKVKGFFRTGRPFESPAEQKQQRAQTATVRNADGTEVLWERMPDGSWRVVQPTTGPPVPPLSGQGILDLLNR